MKRIGMVCTVVALIAVIGVCAAEAIVLQEPDTTTSPTQTFDQIVGQAVGSQIARTITGQPITVTFGQATQPVKAVPVRRTHTTIAPVRNIVPPVVVHVPAQMTVKLDSLQLAALQRANGFRYGWALAFAALVAAVLAYGFTRATQPQPAGPAPVQTNTVSFPDQITIIGLTELAAAIAGRHDALTTLVGNGSFSFTANGSSGESKVTAPSTRVTHTQEHAAGGLSRDVDIMESVQPGTTLPTPAPVTVALGQIDPHTKAETQTTSAA